MRRAITFIILVLVFTAISVISIFSYLSIEVTVNDITYQALRLERVASLCERNRILIRPGDLIGVGGEIIGKEKGRPTEIIINGIQESLEKELTDNDIVRIVRKDLMEEKKLEIIEIEQPVYIIGKGAFVYLEAEGEVGKKEVVRGAVSKKIISEIIIKEPVPTRMLRRKDANSGDNAEKIVALTFDDGPDPYYTKKILEVLHRYNVKASFFVIGELASKYPFLIKEINSEGHTLGNHTLTHRDIELKSESEVRKELLEVNKILKDITGKEVTWFRPPGGEVNDNILKAANSLNLKTVLWDVDPRDWKKYAPQIIYEEVVGKITREDIILLHDGGGNRMNTLNSLPKIIQSLQQKGYSFFTLDDLFTTYEVNRK
ncbi:MAG: polysaccharide deacetylase family protein [Actinomycetia bacterium]|nr:polysaccharide deacetylase family protein [Actinomycetes bacterium]